MHNVRDLGYLAPETIFEREVSRLSNLFSVGVLCYEMMFDKKPYKCENLKSYIIDLQFKNVQVCRLSIEVMGIRWGISYH